jgi:putative transposase
LADFRAGTGWDLSEKCRLLYNFSLQERKQDWTVQKEKEKNKRHYVTYQQQSKSLPEIKRIYPEYRWVYSKVLQQVVKKLDEDFCSFLSLLKKGVINARPPRFKGKYFFSHYVIIKVDLKSITEYLAFPTSIITPL